MFLGAGNLLGQTGRTGCVDSCGDIALGEGGVDVGTEPPRGRGLGEKQRVCGREEILDEADARTVFMVRGKWCEFLLVPWVREVPFPGRRARDVLFWAWFWFDEIQTYYFVPGDPRSEIG